MMTVVTIRNNDQTAAHGGHCSTIAPDVNRGRSANPARFVVRASVAPDRSVVEG
jgi:hypothetical protein